MEKTNLSKLEPEDLDKFAGGGDGKKWARCRCPECGQWFTFEYSPLITCPHCWKEIPVWQGAPGLQAVDGPEG